MREKGGSASARAHQHILMGPWLHLGPGVDTVVGDMGFGEQAGIQGSRLGQYNLTFFNKYVRGMDVDLPKVRYFVMANKKPPVLEDAKSNVSLSGILVAST